MHKVANPATPSSELRDQPVGLTPPAIRSRKHAMNKSLLALALFFALGILVTLFNGDIWSLLQAIFLTALCVVLAVVFVRRHRREQQHE